MTPKERKFRRPLQYFTHNADLTLVDILSWGYLEDQQFLSDIKTLPWWDVEELVQTKNIKQFYYGLDVNQHDQHLWDYIKLEAENRFPEWKPQFPKQDIKVDPVTGRKDITLIIKPPRCLKNMPLRAMEQDFYEEFQGWMYNQSTAEAVISLYDKSTAKSRYQNSGRYWKSKFRDLEIDEFLKKYKHSQRFKEITDKAAKLRRYKLMRPPPTDQTPIEKEENKIPQWDRKCDGDPVYRKY
ncbi:hypothetical protein Hanom_Chr12g01133831 [Helianthus anomalus]